MNYTQSVTQNENLSVYDREYEDILEKTEVIMHDYKMATSNECEKFFMTLLEGEYKIPENSFSERIFLDHLGQNTLLYSVTRNKIYKLFFVTRINIFTVTLPCLNSITPHYRPILGRIGERLIIEHGLAEIVK